MPTPEEFKNLIDTDPVFAQAFSRLNDEERKKVASSYLEGIQQKNDPGDILNNNSIARADRAIEERSTKGTPVSSFIDVIKQGKGAAGPVDIEGTIEGIAKSFGAFGQATSSPIAAIGLETARAGDVLSRTLFGEKEAYKEMSQSLPNILDAFKMKDNVRFKDVNVATDTPEPLAEILGFTEEMAFDPTAVKPKAITKAGKVLVNSTENAFTNVMRFIRKAPKVSRINNKVITGEEMGKRIINNIANRVEKEGAKAGIKFNREVAYEANKINQSLAQLADDIADESFAGAIKFQEGFPKYFKDASKSYGKALENLTEDTITGSVKINTSKITDSLNETMSDMANNLIDNPEFLDDMISFAKKRGINFDPKSNSFNILNESEHELKSLILDYIKIKKPLGNKGAWYDNSDRAILAFQKNFGDVIAEVSPEFSMLQNQYKEVIQLRNAAAKMFKPKQGEEALKTAENALKRLANSKPGQISRSDMAIIEKLETGIEGMTEGLGGITINLKKLKKEKEALEALKKVVGKKSNVYLDAVKESEKRSKKIIESQLEKISALRRLKKKSVVPNMVKTGLKISGGAVGLYLLKRQFNKIMRG